MKKKDTASSEEIFYANKSLERQETEKNRKFTRSISSKIMVFALLLIGIMSLSCFLTHDITTDIQFECKGENIGINMSYDYITQNYTCNIAGDQQGTCFRQDRLMDFFELDGIGGLQCSGNAHIKAPLWAILLGLAE